MAHGASETIDISAEKSDGAVGGCPVRWRRSTRARRVSLRIDARAGEVVVTLPPRANRRAGMALLTTHAAWVMERLASLSPHVALVPGRRCRSAACRT